MANFERFEIELSTDLAQFVRSQVGEGALASDADVVREAVRVLQRQSAKLAELRSTVTASIEDPRSSLSTKEVRARLAEHAHTLNTRGDHA